MHKRTKFCNISPSVKKEVAERDSIDGYPCCILCGNPNCAPNAHYIPRSQGGLGIPQNIVTLCHECHTAYDNSDNRNILKVQIREYLENCYEDWNEHKLVYHKGD